MEIAEKIERHRRFLSRDPVDRPLLGTCVGGWEDLSRYVDDPRSFFPAGSVDSADLTPARFRGLYDRYRDALTCDDDLVRPLEPLPFFPWTEAAAGCPVEYTGRNFWARPAPGSFEAESVRRSATADEYLGSYRRMIELLRQSYGDGIPIGQTILRGPLDMAAAALGEQALLLSLFDRPAFVKDLLGAAAGIVERFLEIHASPSLAFHGGFVLGSYYLWTPGSCARIQEDAMALLSPDLYDGAVAPVDARLSRSAEFVLYHMHSSGLHLLPGILATGSFAVIQISKDEGIEGVAGMLPSLRAVQEAERCLVVKGRLSRQDVADLRESLDARGLCVQAVVDDESAARDFLGAW